MAVQASFGGAISNASATLTVAGRVFTGTQPKATAAGRAAWVVRAAARIFEAARLPPATALA
jgi:hypothetical protein